MQPETLQVLQVMASSFTVILMSFGGVLKTREINSIKTSAKKCSWKSDARTPNEQ